MSESPLAAIATFLHGHPDLFRAHVKQTLFNIEPQARLVFGLATKEGHRDLGGALAWIVRNADARGRLGPDVREGLKLMARLHRRHGFNAKLYRTFGRICNNVLEDLAGERFDPEHIAAANVAVRTACAILQKETITADLAGAAPAQVATVTDVRRASNRISVVRLEAGPGALFSPGQAVAVTTTYTFGMWRWMFPAAQIDYGNTLEFHVQSVEEGQASRLWAAAREGDFWTIGPAVGGVDLPESGHIAILSYATGLAGAEALLFSLLEKDHNLRVDFYVCAEYPSELYDLDRLRRIEASTSWLRVIATSLTSVDQWWVPRPPAERLSAADVGAHIVDPSRLVSRFIDHVIVFGPEHMVEESVEKLKENGVDEEKIDPQPFRVSSPWTTKPAPTDRAATESG